MAGPGPGPGGRARAALAALGAGGAGGGGAGPPLRELAAGLRAAADAGAGPGGGLPPAAWAGALGLLGALLAGAPGAAGPAARGGVGPAACGAVRALCTGVGGPPGPGPGPGGGASAAAAAFAREALRGRETMLAGLLLPLVHLAAGPGAAGGGGGARPPPGDLEGRVLALRALEDLVWAAGAGGADLTPFLPGLVSGAARCLGEFGRGSSLVPLRARAEALAAALRVLAAALVVTHGGARDRAPPGAGRDGASAGDDVLERLRRATVGGGEGGAPGGAEAEARIRLVLAQALPGACLHPSLAVRRAAAAALCWLVRRCSLSLRGSAPLFLDGLLQLCHDPAAAVHAPVRAVLLEMDLRPGAAAPASSPGMCQDTLGVCLAEFMRRLPTTARGGDAEGLARTCRQAGSLLQLWLRALAAGWLPPLLPEAVRGILEALRQSLSLSPEGASGRAAPVVVGRTAGGGSGADLPRPPEGLEFLRAAGTYAAVRGLCRALGLYILGEMCLGAGRGARHLTAYTEECFAPLLGAAGPAAAPDASGPRDLRDAALRAAAATVAATEVSAGVAEAASLPLYSAVTGLGVTAEGRESFAGLAADLAGAWTSEGLWDLADAAGGAAVGGALRLQTALAEGVGTLARCLPAEFRAHPELLPGVLLPLLERLGHPDAGQREGAHAAVRSVLAHCGFETASHMVADFGNRALGTLCQRLPLVELHPRAERGLVAALVLAAERPLPLLIRMLADPAALFVRQLGLSGPARFRGVPVERALYHIASLAEGDLERHRARLRGLDLSDPDPAFAELQALRTAARSSAGLAQGALEAAVPLVLAAREEGRDLVPALLAWASALGALEASSSIDKAFDSLPDSAKPAFAAKPDDPEVLTVAQGAARILPPLLAVLAPGDVPAAAPALDLLARLAAFPQAGELLRREFARQVWPVLKEALELYLAPAATQDAALGVGRRARLDGAACTVLRALARLVSVPDHGPAMFRDAVHPAAELLAANLRAGHGEHVRAALKAALAALGGVDPDAVWLLVARATRLSPPLPPAPPLAAACGSGGALRPLASLFPGARAP